MYSQNGEDALILQHFENFKGSVLDIGANDGLTFSNSRLLIENGWIGTLLEPSPLAYEKCQQLYKNDPYTIAYNFGISNVSGELEFYESASHLPSGEDIALLSGVPSRISQRWLNSVKFSQTKAKFLTFDDFSIQYLTEEQTFDVISIDAEGYDYDILSQINLAKYKTKLLCIEWNSIQELQYLFTDYSNQYGLREIHRNEENILFALKN